MQLLHERPKIGTKHIFLKKIQQTQGHIHVCNKGITASPRPSLRHPTLYQR